MEEMIFLASDLGLIRGSFSPEKREIIDRSLTEQKVTSVIAAGDHLIVGTWEGIFQSSDRGESWSAAANGLRNEHVRWLAFHPEKRELVMAGFEPATIHISEDAAITWNERPEIARLRDHFNWMLPYSPKSGCVRGFYLQGSRAYAAVEVGGLLRSDDWGKSWSLVPASSGIPDFGLPATGAIHADVHSVNGHPSSADLIIAPTGGGFFISEDGGESFERRYPPCYCRAVWVDPADASHLVLGPAGGVDRNGRIMETFNSGESWAPIESGLETPWPRTMVERFYGHEGHLLALLSNGSLFLSEVGLWNWVQIFDEVTDIRALAVEDSV